MEIGLFSLVSILPEIILIIGGLLILLLDATAGKRRDSGQGYMAISVLFLLVGLDRRRLPVGRTAAGRRCTWWRSIRLRSS